MAAAQSSQRRSRSGCCSRKVAGAWSLLAAEPLVPEHLLSQTTSYEPLIPEHLLSQITYYEPLVPEHLLLQATLYATS